MPRKKVKDYWAICPPRNNLLPTRDVTWKDIQECIQALNDSGEDVFAGLHRHEGGFMCVDGPDGFRSTDRIDAGLPHQNPPDQGEPISHREIRFGWRSTNWPSRYGSFLDNDLLTDDWIVAEKGKMTSLKFRGENCVPWSRDRCKRLATVISDSLGLEHKHWNATPMAKRMRGEF